MTEAAEATAVAASSAQTRTVRIHLDRLLVERGMGVKELAEAIKIHPNNVSKIKNGRIEGIRLDTLGAICAVLNCQPGELLTYEPHADD
ncbi:helix-turn-helix transcriptional regulator [Streptomyces sp. NPDC051907]|uniref:helix-turn-helix domain-containing protein n=1 Tax=Streptomyces sp. NPDC051907 TaxID=3155284 RepID=UPI0034417BB6